MLKLILTFQSLLWAISSPVESMHPGSEIYTTKFTVKSVSCGGEREAIVYLPDSKSETTSTIVFGHGQSLNLSHYEESFEHFSKKGVALVFPDFSTWVFDTNWLRMGRDYVDQATCVLEKEGLNKELVVFSGHSKGAYVASVAAGLSFKDDLLQPKSLVLLNASGFEASLLPFILEDVEVTVIFSDQDRVVEESISKDIYNLSLANKKQFIRLNSYPETESNNEVAAIHMWPLNKPFLFFGGGPVGPLHYYGFWKWLLASAFDVESGAMGENTYLYGDEAVNKGVDFVEDSLERNF